MTTPATQKRFQVAALQQRQFKAPVEVKLPSDSVDTKGAMQYDALHFIARFRSIPADEARRNLQRVQALRAEDAPLDEVLTESMAQTKSYVLGIEKHPEHPFPFVAADGQTDADITPELIAELLNVREIRDAIESTYNKARSGELLVKNSKQ